MGEELKKQYEIRDLKQELQIRTEQNAELYAKLCNALMQLEEANKVILGLYKPYDASLEPATLYLDKWKVK